MTDKQEIKDEYEVFTERFETEPVYALVRKRFKDEENSNETFIKLYASADEHDEDIFYYCDSLNDLLDLMDEDNGEDFVVAEVLEFTDVIY